MHDSFDAPGGGFHPTDNLVATRVSDNFGIYASIRAAARFTVGAGPYTLDSVTLPISFEALTASDGFLRIRLAEDASGAPGATLEVLSDGAPWPAHASPFTGTTTLLSSLHPTLVAGASYWIVAEPNAVPGASPPFNVSYRWFHNSGVTEVAARQQQVGAAGTLPADPWPGASFAAPLAFRADGTFAGEEPPDGCVSVGDPGNACDPQLDGCFGAVSYDYDIAVHETTIGEYTAFLNAVAADDENGLWNEEMVFIVRSGAPGTYQYEPISSLEDLPVSGVRFYDVLRYANWLHNGQPSGLQTAATTEDGAYPFDGATSVGPRRAEAAYALPSEDEWYKAAYYYGPGDYYFDYPTMSDVEPLCVPPDPGANLASCGFTAGAGSMTDVGSYPGSPGPHGTFDQAGNVWEWTEGAIAQNRVVRGGSWINVGGDTGAWARVVADPATIDAFGFRVVCLPEPGLFLALASGALALARLDRRRRSRSEWTTRRIS